MINQLFDKAQPHLGVSCYNIKDFVYSNLISETVRSEKSIFCKKTQVRSSVKDFYEYIEAEFKSDDWQTIQTAYNGGLIINRKTKEFVEYVSEEQETYISIFGTNHFLNKHIDTFEAKFPKGVSISWYYSPDDSPSTVYIDMSKLPVDEMYPNLDRPLKQYYDDFIKSSANIIILIGPPGTGKSTFLRGLIEHYDGVKPLVTYDPAILERDGFFNHFVTGNNDLLIIEDADNFLKPRSDGNNLIPKFLNLGDGLLSIKGKKLIFTTNLPSAKDIDEAMTRPGRCFDILSFGTMNVEEGKKLIEKMPDLKIPEGKQEFVLAEMFNHSLDNTPKKIKKFGFGV